MERQSSSKRHHFPTVFFLDFDVFQNSQMEIPKISLSVSPFEQDIVRDPANFRGVASQYFNTIHLWMPIISKKRFYEHLLNPLLQPRTDVAMLCLCMRLITWLPSDSEKSPETTIYLTAKRCFTEAETAGILTIQGLQAGLLISLYEVGHAMYPSAYISIGSCARYGFALGINWKAVAPSYTWIELEERRRVWWAVVILERFGPLLFISGNGKGWPMALYVVCHGHDLTRS
jgi:hypothetical protein